MTIARQVACRNPGPSRCYFALRFLRSSRTAWIRPTDAPTAETIEASSNGVISRSDTEHRNCRPQRLTASCETHDDGSNAASVSRGRRRRPPPADGFNDPQPGVGAVSTASAPHLLDHLSRCRRGIVAVLMWPEMGDAVGVEVGSSAASSALRRLSKNRRGGPIIRPFQTSPHSARVNPPAGPVEAGSARPWACFLGRLP
jgi:hypothetical protein